MELLLNLVWLLLAVPAYLLWHESGNVRARYSLTALQTLLALGCALVLLFPVISATDDLHAMRAEIEESPSSKRNVRPVSNDKVSGWNIRLQTPPAIAEGFGMFAPAAEHALVTVSPNFSLPTQPAILCVGRGPPADLLA